MSVVVLYVLSAVLVCCIGSSMSLSSPSDCTSQQVNACVDMSPDTTCFDTKIPFSKTSLSLTQGSSVAAVQDELMLWRGLQHVPQCWQIVQSFLCSVYLPKCDDSNVSAILVELPSRETCQTVHESCKIVSALHTWPDFLTCNQPHFRTLCENAYEKQEFNKSTMCLRPLVNTEKKERWFHNVSGCSVSWQNPMYTDAEHDSVHIMIAVFGAACIITTLFTLLTFLFDWTNSRRYPGVILFYMNGCFFLATIGWMVQFAGDVRGDIVGNADGTPRRGQPQLGSGESATCTVIFLLIYYFSVAVAVWFVPLGYAWYVTFRALGKSRQLLLTKTAYFHIAAWCLPLVLSVICLIVAEVDGDSLTGVCFIGHESVLSRVFLVLVPFILMLLVGLFFLVKGLLMLVGIRKNTPTYISNHATAKIRETIMRLALFILLSSSFLFVVFVVHMYSFANHSHWQDKLKEYIYCQGLTATGNANLTSGACELESRPSLLAMALQILMFFCGGITLSSWSWTRASLSVWERFFRRLFRKPSVKPVKQKKHKMIAHAFQRRQHLVRNGTSGTAAAAATGRMSLSYCSEDPHGLKIDLNSVTSNDISSSFAAAIPKLVRRRGGMALPVTGSLRRYSDSDVQSVISHMSRRRSGDSQVSHLRVIHISDREIREETSTISTKRVPRRKRKRHKKRSHRIQPELGPLSIPSGSGRLRVRRPGTGLPGRRSRHGSGTSGGSRTSSNRSSIQRSSADNSSSQSRPGSRLSRHGSLGYISNKDFPPPPKHLTNFDLFTASSFLPGALDLVDLSQESSVQGQSSHLAFEMTDANFYASRRHSKPRRSRFGRRHSSSSSQRHSRRDSVFTIERAVQDLTGSQRHTRSADDETLSDS